MTTKRKTKAQREAEQKAALCRRVSDVYSGAIGMEWSDDEFATAELLSRILPALRDLFGSQAESQGYLWGNHCLRHFDNPNSATEHLFGAGVRA